MCLFTAFTLSKQMDNETNGLKDEFLARHTTDPALRSMLSNHETLTTQRPTDMTEVKTNVLSIKYSLFKTQNKARNFIAFKTNIFACNGDKITNFFSTFQPLRFLVRL